MSQQQPPKGVGAKSYEMAFNLPPQQPQKEKKTSSEQLVDNAVNAPFSINSFISGGEQKESSSLNDTLQALTANQSPKVDTSSFEPGNSLSITDIVNNGANSSQVIAESQMKEQKNMDTRITMDQL